MRISNRKTLGSSLWMIGLAVALATAAQAQLDVAGDWDVTADVTIPMMPAATSEGEASRLAGESEGGEIAGEQCSYSGTASIGQQGNDVSGMVMLDLEMGGAGCPGELNGGLAGTTDDMSLMGTLTSGNEEASIMGAPQGQGQVSTGPGQVTSAQAPPSLGGSILVTAGPFTGASGVWTGVGMAPAADIPTLGVTGLAALTLALLLGGALVMRRAP